VFLIAVMLGCCGYRRCVGQIGLLFLFCNVGTYILYRGSIYCIIVRVDGEGGRKVKKNSYREKMAAFQFAHFIKTKTKLFFFAKPGWSLRISALAQRSIKTAHCVTFHSFSARQLFLPGKFHGSNNVLFKTLLS